MDLLRRMGEQRADFMVTFRRRTDLPRHDTDSDDETSRMSIRATNPAYIPCNHRVEQAINAAMSEDDFTPMERLLEVLANPFEDHPEHVDLARPPKPEEVLQRTFCGTRYPLPRPQRRTGRLRGSTYVQLPIMHSADDLQTANCHTAQRNSSHRRSTS